MLTALLLFDGAGKARKLLHLARRRRSSSRALGLRPRKVMIAIPRTIAGATIAIFPRPMRAGDRFAGRREGAAATNPCAKLSRVVKSASRLWASSSLHLSERRAFRKTCRLALICTCNNSASVSGVPINTPVFGRHITASQCGPTPLTSPCRSEPRKPSVSASTCIVSGTLPQPFGPSKTRSTCEASRTFPVKHPLPRPKNTTSWHNRVLRGWRSLKPSAGCGNRLS